MEYNSQEINNVFKFNNFQNFYQFLNKSATSDFFFNKK